MAMSRPQHQRARSSIGNLGLTKAIKTSDVSGASDIIDHASPTSRPPLPKAQSSIGNPGLTKAIKASNVSGALQVIDDAPPEAKEALLAQGLSDACQQNQAVIVQELMSRGADPRKMFQKRAPPLLDAVRKDNSTIVQHLLKSDKLPRAAEIGKDASDKDRTKGEPASREDLQRAALLMAKSREVAELLINDGASLDSKKDGKTLLMEASRPFVVELLIEKNVPIDVEDESGNTALMRTVIYDDDPAKAKLLIERGNANIEGKDKVGRTILMNAIWKSRLEVIKLLISREVNVNASDDRGRDAVHHLASDPDRQYEYRPDLKAGSQQERDQLILELLTPHIEADAKDHRGRTCLHWAVSRGSSGLLRLLLRTQKFRVNAVEHKFRTPLHLAAAHGQKKCVEVLLEHGAHVNAESEGEWTPLHNACERSRDSLAIVKLLLDKGAVLDRKTRNGESPLHIAAAAGNLEVVRFFLTHKEVKRTTRDAFGNTPLLRAARSQPKVQDEKIPDDKTQDAKNRHAKTKADKKPDENNPDDNNRSDKDRNDKKPRGKGQQESSPEEKARQEKARQEKIRQEKERKREELVALFAPWNNLHALTPEAIRAAQLFNATVVDFGEKLESIGGTTVRAVSIYDLLYAKSKDDATRPKVRVTASSQEKVDFRWIHLPANNVPWCEDLFTKHFIEEKATNVSTFKALERSFNHQHRGEEPQARYMTPLCQTILQSGVSEEVEYPGDDEFEQRVLSRSSTFNEKLERTATLPESPMRTQFAHHRDYIIPQIETRTEGFGVNTADRARRHSSFNLAAAQRRGNDNEQRKFVSEDRPDAGISRRATFKEPDDDGAAVTESPTLAQDTQFKDFSMPTKLKRAETFNNRFQPGRSRTFPNTLVGDQQGFGDGSISDFYIFMPYLHFETFRERQEMFNSYSCPQCGRRPCRNIQHQSPQVNEQIQRSPSEIIQFPTSERDEALIQEHLNSSDNALHIRRTLDQSFYHHIDTEFRDRTQVIHRFQRDIERTKHEPKVLMVDQLWMWVIGKKLVVTSFPQRWRQPKKDPLNVLQSILSTVTSKNREHVQSVYDLAMIISGRCYGAYDRHGIGSEEIQFLDMFEGWIGAAMDDEIKLFKRFREDSKNASVWLREPPSNRNFAQRKKKKKKAAQEARHESEYKTIKHADDATYTSDDDFVENLLDIGRETALLEEIKDIQDELDMLSLVFERQAQVLPSIEDALVAICKQEQWPTPVIQKFGKAFQDHQKTISHPQKDIQRMERQAGRMYNSINNLLDLKQKHANAIEARYAREQTYGASRQTKTLMVFTIVTVIFLPLTFIAALFTIDIDGFPHKHGVQSLSMGFVSRYVAHTCPKAKSNMLTVFLGTSLA